VTRPLDLAPRRIDALGLTYRDHAAETVERIAPEGPAVFERDPASLATGDVLCVPSRTAILQTRANRLSVLAAGDHTVRLEGPEP
jgi:hypothetical protein